MKRGWFGPKTYGWGATPTSWEGWLATAVMVVALLSPSLMFASDSTSAWISRGVVLIVYLAVVILTYRPRS